MTCTIKVFDEITNTSKDITFKNVMAVEACEPLECITIIHDNGNKKKLIPMHLVKELDCEDIKTVSLI